MGMMAFDAPRVRAAVMPLAPPAGVLLLQLVLLPVPLGTMATGAVAGLIGSLIAVGLALVWQSNQVVNFAAGSLGLVPATFVVMLADQWGWNWIACLVVGLLAAVLLGWAIEAFIVRRFFESPRVLLTVATIGVAQLLTFFALLMPRLWGEQPTVRTLPEPMTMSFTIGGTLFDGSDLVALVAVPLVLVAWIGALRWTRLGIAVRAAADRSSRALTLGIPVKRLHGAVWASATVAGFLSIFLAAGSGGLGVGYTVGLGTLVRAIAAVVLARMTRLGSVVATSIVLGVLELAVQYHFGDSNLVAPLLAALIIGALVLRRRGLTRSARDDTSSWRMSADSRPIPRSLARLPEVRVTRVVAAGLTSVALIAAPFLLSTGLVLKLGAILIAATVGVSLVVLSGWAGQLSLGQMAIAGLGGAVFAWGVRTADLEALTAIVLAAIVGATASFVVGLPALRLRGTYLAVSTLALALALSYGVFDNGYVDWIPTESFAGDRPALLDRIPMDTPAELYLLALVVLLLALLAAHRLRTSQAGRILIGVRENESATQALGVSVTRAKLSAFALSGAIAATAGAVLTMHQGAFKSDLFLPDQSIAAFIAVVIGGLGSLGGAVIGAVFLRGSALLTPPWSLLATSVGALIVLMALPDGIGGALTRLRNLGLTAVAKRHGIVEPSLNELGDPEALAGSEPGADETGDSGPAVAQPPSPADADGGANSTSMLGSDTDDVATSPTGEPAS